MKPAQMGCEDVVSIAAVVEDEEIRRVIMLSDYIRNETLKRCEAYPSFRYKSRKWGNRYYDYFKHKVEEELKAKMH